MHQFRLEKCAINIQGRLIIAASYINDNIRANTNITKTRKQKLEEKQLNGYFKRRNWNIAQKKNRKSLRNLKKRENEPVLIAKIIKQWKNTEIC